MTLLSLGRKALKKCLGNHLEDLLFYNILKWALNRDKLFQLVSPLQREKIIAKAEILDCKDRQIIAEVGKKASSVIVCLEGKIN